MIEPSSSVIHHNVPAACWQEAYPLGNGHMGMMFRGAPGTEEVDLSEIGCFSGSTEAGIIPDDAPQAFRLAREAAMAGDFDGMTRHLQQFIPERGQYGTQLPLGRLVFHDGSKPDEGSFRRSLDLESGIACCSWQVDGLPFERLAFVSHPDRVGVFVLRSGAPASVLSASFSPTFSLDGGANPHLSHVSTVLPDGSLESSMQGHAFEGIHSDGRNGVSYAAVARLLPPADGVRMLLVACATSFDCEDPAAACRVWLDRAAGRSAVALQSRHAADFSAHMRAASLSFETQDVHLERLPLPERLARVRAGERDDALLPLLWQYGRYLLFSSSRSTSPTPAPLQGVWNDNVACRIGWTCDMHLDINTQMNYWPSETTGLSACGEPLFRWIRDTLVPNGREAARRAYGLSGWTAELVSNAWGFAAPYWHTNIAPYPTGGAWTATHLWEHWLFTGDRDFLETTCFPVLEGAAEFFLGYLFPSCESEGLLESGPSISPENSFLFDGAPVTNSLSPACETVVIREILQDFADACALCSPEHPLRAAAASALSRLRSLRIGPDGGVAEWAHDLPACDPQHRHTSQLLSLYPFAQITPEMTPELAQAASRTIAMRLMPESGWEDTGWARSMLMLYEARLQHADEADRHLQAMLAGLAQPNLLIRHPPTRGAPSFADVYELDGNTGATACITEILLQSHGGIIRLLPALPRHWPDGRAEGLRARGGWRVDLQWRSGRLDSATLTGKPGAVCRISVNGRMLDHVAGADGCIRLCGESAFMP